MGDAVTNGLASLDRLGEDSYQMKLGLRSWDGVRTPIPDQIE